MSQCSSFHSPVPVVRGQNSTQSWSTPLWLLGWPLPQYVLYGQRINVISHTCLTTTKRKYVSSVSYTVVRGVPSTHFHRPSTPLSVKPIHGDLPEPYKPLRNTFEGKYIEFKTIAMDFTHKLALHWKMLKRYFKQIDKHTISSGLFMTTRSAPLLAQFSLLRAQVLLLADLK